MIRGSEINSERFARIAAMFQRSSSGQELCTNIDNEVL